MTRYEQGFYKAAARYESGHALGMRLGGVQHGGYGAGYVSGHGSNTAGLVSPNASMSLSLSDAALNNSLLGAGIGAVSGITREALRDDNERKHYLKSLLRGILYGGGIGLASTVIGGVPDIVGKLKNR